MRSQCKINGRVVEMDIVYWTGLLSFASQYTALVIVTVFIVDYLSYRSKKALLIATIYFCSSLVIYLAIANFILQIGDTMLYMTFLHSYNNILLTIANHVFFGLLILCLQLKTIILGTKSLAVNAWNHVQNQN
jgi:hypothetical protein